MKKFQERSAEDYGTAPVSESDDSKGDPPVVVDVVCGINEDMELSP